MNKKTFIIAEAGVNHNGSLDTALRLIDSAKSAGADCVKFQTFKAEALVSRRARRAEYQAQNTGSDGSQLSMLKRLELTEDEFFRLRERCDSVGIEFLSTPFDLETISFLEGIVAKWKIPSGEITNLPYLIKLAKTGKPIIMSTGMSSLAEVSDAIRVLNENGGGNVTLLHCTTEYPAPIQDVNLRAMLTMKEKFHLPVGYSDHTQGIAIPIAAVAMGATVIEKHFTLDRSMEGPDHKASLEPDELKAMVDAIRQVEAAFGNGEKAPSESERKNISVARKSIIAKTDIRKGEILTEANITTKRPGNGISPMRWFEVLGTPAARDFEEDELIEL